MNAMTIDTHKAVKALEQAGAKPELAGALVGLVSEAVASPDMRKHATKTDLDNLEAKVSAEIADTKVQLIHAVLGIVGFLNGLLFYALKH